MPYHNEGDKMKKILVKETKKPKKKTQEQIFDIKKNMSIKKALKEHSKHHSKKHMDEMKKLIKEGKSFNAAHKLAMKKMGK